MDQKPCGPVAGDVDLIQYFRMDEDDIIGIEVMVATYLKLVNRPLTFRLYRIDDPIDEDDIYGMISATIESGTPIATASKADWTDNEAFTLPIDPLTIARDARYVLHATAAIKPGPELTIWLHCGSSRIPGHIAAWYDGVDQGAFGLRASLVTANPQASSPVPQAILYSPVTQCNLNCIHCISAETRSTRSIMSAGIKESIRGWCRQGLVTQIATDYSGDILWADRKFGGEFDFLESLDIPIHIDTNGVHLDAAASGRLVGLQLQSINISLDAATTETFQRVRKGAPPLEDVVANIASFMEARRKAGAEDRIAVSLSFTLMRSTLHELEDFIRLAASLGITLVHARHLEAYTERMGPESLIFDRQGFNRRLERAMILANGLGVTLASALLPESYGRISHSNCRVAWGSAVIMGNGDVAVCCVPRTTIGNLHHNSMEEIWNGEQYQEFRRRVNSASPPPQCSACPIMRDWHNVHSYLPFLTIDSWTNPRDW